jgi:hypothetical protein
MRGVRAVILDLMVALFLSGCISRTAPAANVQPQSNLNSMAYGQSYGTAPAPAVMAYAAAPTPAVYLGRAIPSASANAGSDHVR